MFDALPSHLRTPLPANKSVVGDDTASLIHMAQAVSKVVPNVLVSRGARGVLVPDSFRAKASPTLVRFLQLAPKAVPAEKIVDATGAGDSFVAGFVAAFVKTHRAATEMPTSDWQRCIDAGLAAAALTLQSPLPVSPSLTSNILL